MATTQHHANIVSLPNLPDPTIALSQTPSGYNQTIF